MGVLVKNNMIESMLQNGATKHDVERRLAEIALGIVGALRRSAISHEDAYDDLFNLDTFLSLEKHHLSRPMKKLFQWGMELEDVAEIAPDGMEESYQAIEALAGKVLLKVK